MNSDRLPTSLQMSVNGREWTVSERALASLHSAFIDCSEAFILEMLRDARPTGRSKRRAAKWRTGRRYRRIGLLVVPYANDRGLVLVSVIGKRGPAHAKVSGL